MDENQKRLLCDKEGEIAESVCAEQLIKLLHEAKLISKDQKDQIMSQSEVNFNRNLKIIEAVQASKAPDAFKKFYEALERLRLDTTKLFGPRYATKQKGYFHRFEQFLPTFGRNVPMNNSSHSIGINSYKFNSTSPIQGMHSTSGSSTSYKMANENASPRADRLSLATPPKDLSHIDESSSNSFNPTVNDCGYVLARRHPNGQLPSGSVTLHSSGSRRGSAADDGSNHVNSDNVRAANLINNLSLKEESEEQSGSDSDEPIIQWHAYPSCNETMRAGSPHRCNPSYSSASSESGESTSESMILDHNLILDSNVMSALARDGPELMTVKRAEICHNNPEEDYKMTSRPRGKCLIVNNIDFDYEIFPTRKGSDEDANRFDKIFQQLGFETVMKRNLRAEEMKEVFHDLAAACKPEHDALFVFILSHGSEKGIYGTDGLEIHLEDDIISCFDNRNCKAMLGKPKVFVIQACRGRAKDFGIGFDGDTTDSVAWPSVLASPTVQSASQENRVPASWLPSARPLDGKKRKHPIRTDMLLVFSCLAGFVSVRNETAGSWLGVALAYFLMTHAHERDLMRILNLVTSDIIQRESAHGHIQSIETKLLGWTKNLYFNPGHYL